MRCRAVAEALVKPPDDQLRPARAIGGIVPHAGWICSGAIAGQTLAALAGDVTPQVVVVFGAVHTPIDLPLAALESHERWSTPAGDAHIARDLAESLEKSSQLFITDDRLHVREHAVEVELPLIRAVWREARVLPVEVPAVDRAVDIGRQTARLVLEKGLKAVFLASSDLTHYGPSYGFTPAGVGERGIAWAKENDRKLLRRVENLEIDSIVPEARENLNACGAGAIAAMLAACQEAGATGSRVLRHASSYETLADVAPQPPIDAVGYAAVVVS